MRSAVDAKIWTVGATLFTFLYLTLGVVLSFASVVVALVLAAWVLGEEIGGEEGLKYVSLELAPSLAFVGIFAVSVVALGPLRDGLYPPLVGSTLFTVQYAQPMATLATHPIWFFFPLLPLTLGGAMSAYQRSHPLAGIIYQTTPPAPTRVHVHLHQGRRTQDGEEDDEESDEVREAPRHVKPRRSPVHPPVRLALRPAHRTLARSRSQSSHQHRDEDAL
jgi:hypothetical protein